MNALRAAALAALFCCAVAAQAKCRLQTMELPVRVEGWRAIATVGINGTPVPMMVDSGMFYSMLAPDSAAQLGLHLQRLPAGYAVHGLAGDVVNLRKTLVKSVQLQDAHIEDIEFLVGGNDSGLGAMGLIGRNILGAFDVEYDLAHGMIRLVKPDGCDNANMAYWAGDLPVSKVALLPDLSRVRPEIRAKVMLNGHEVMASFDTGAGTLVSLKAAHAAGLQDADLRGSSVGTGLGAGHIKEWTGRFDRVSLGGETVINNHLSVGDFDFGSFDMLMGIDFFLSHRIYVSKDRSLMFFTYNGGPVFARNVEPQADPASAPASQVADTLSADALFRRGAASLARNDVAGALADLDRACAMAPGNARYRYARAQAHERANDGAKALADLDAALALDPKLDDARLMRASSWSLGGDRARGLQDLAILDSTLPERADIRKSVAWAYGEWGRPALAIRQLTLWIDNHPHDVWLPGAYRSRCFARVASNIELDQAKADCDEAIEREPDNADARSTRGWLQLRLNQPAKARADFDAAIKLHPTESFALYGRALVHTKLGETAAAQADLAAARSADPKVEAELKNYGLETGPWELPQASMKEHP